MAPQLPPTTPADRAALSERWSQLPAMQHLGARADFTGPAAVRVIISPLQPYHRGGMGTGAVNGAVIAGLCDAAIGMVGHLHAGPRRLGTVQLGIHFLRPLEGDSVTAIGRLIRAGTTLIFAGADVEDADGQICARGEGIVALLGEPDDPAR